MHYLLWKNVYIFYMVYTDFSWRYVVWCHFLLTVCLTVEASGSIPYHLTFLIDVPLLALKINHLNVIIQRLLISKWVPIYYIKMHICRPHTPILSHNSYTVKTQFIAMWREQWNAGFFVPSPIIPLMCPIFSSICLPLFDIILHVFNHFFVDQSVQGIWSWFHVNWMPWI